MADGAWTAAEAKAKFSELMDKARTEGPQRVTKNGREAVVVISAEAWAKTGKPLLTTADVLLNPKFRGLLSDDEMDVFLEMANDRTVDRPPIKF